ncbi:DNA polymerase [Leclercia sp. Marseille-Q4284]|uniref:DNA polymerase n=1 Tax=Leclercia sp. Marseille-Q4284 TaxID=2866582 RepID=UPI00351D16E0
MVKLYCDLETYSDIPIKHGSHRYSEGAEVMLFAYALDEGPIYVWDKTTGEPMPANLAAWLKDDSIETVWHNGGNFDTVVLRSAMGLDLPLERVTDTMVQALQHGLPGKLADLCEVFSVKSDEAKDKDGKRLINLFCKTQIKKGKRKVIDANGEEHEETVIVKEWRNTRETHPHDWARFVKYAGSDILAMRAIHRKMPRWNCTAKELALWRLDQTINRRGVLVDTELAHGAIAAVEQEQARLAAQTFEMTAGEVEAATQRDKLLKYICASYGVTLPDMQSATLERRINDPDLPAPLRELLAVRLSSTTSSTAKYKTLINNASSDGRLRGLLQFCGAARTGRWAGRMWQPQNLPRPTLKPDAISAAIGAFKGGYSDLVVPDIMAAASSALRGCIIAPIGKKLVITDLSNIEGRVLTKLANEAWKIEAFKANDAGTGHDLYILAYAKAFGITPEEVEKHQRQIGKVLELSMGFAGGVGAFAAMALAYGMDLDDLAAKAGPAIPAHIWDKAVSMRSFMDSKGRGMSGLSENTWLVCESLKQLWREAHPEIVKLWAKVEKAAKDAICGKPSVVNGLKFDRKGAWLRIRLPSGRFLSYPAPAVDLNKDGVFYSGLSYMGTCPYSRKWKRLKTFGGKLVENIVQAIARDVLAENMAAIEAAGYHIVLTVHDEVITEAPAIASYNAIDLSRLLAIVPAWMQGLPLMAKGFEADRYRKDD